jgi:hypothetical protein
MKLERRYLQTTKCDIKYEQCILRMRDEDFSSSIYSFHIEISAK